MKLGTGNRRQSILAGVLGVLAVGACIFLYEELFATGAPVPASPVVVVTAPVGSPANTVAAVPGNVAKAMGTTSASLDPTLHLDAMLVTESVAYQGVGRNIFSAVSAPPLVIAKAQFPARPVPQPAPGPPPPPPGPPPPPPIDLKFFGTETSGGGVRQAFLLHGEDVFLASAGDVVQRRYRVISIEAKSVQVEDMQNNNKQFLPLLAN